MNRTEKTKGKTKKGKRQSKFLCSDNTILPYAKTYLTYILLGAPFMCSSMVMNNQLRFQGNALYAMLGMGVGSILNIFLAK